MKVSPEHYAKLVDAICPVDTETRRHAYLSGDFPRAETVKDLDMRFRWDMFYIANGPAIVRDGNYTSDHIDTALRKIVQSL